LPRTRLASACENWVFRASHTSVPREINDDLPGADFWESARFDLSDYRLVARHNFRVAVIRLACGLVSPLPVTSELGRPQQTCAPAVFFRGLPEAELVSGIERQSAGDCANQGCHVRRLFFRNGTNSVGRNLSATAPPLIRLAPHPHSHLGKPRSATWRVSLRTHRSTSNMSRRPRRLRRGGSDYLPTLNRSSPAIVRNTSSLTSRRP